MTTSTSPASDPGPWSSIFNYEDEVRKEEERKKQLQESQQKIMRTNVLGDAFRLLMDGVGGSMGATITPKAVNPGILKAADRYHAIEKESEGNLQRMRLQDLASKEKNLQYKLGLEAEQRGLGRQIEAEKRAEGRQIEAEGRQATRQDELYKRAKEDKALDAENEFNMFQKKTGVQTDAQIRAMKEKNKIDQDNLTRQVPRNKMRTKEDIPFIVPGTQQTIYIRPEEIEEMQHQLTKDKERYDPELDQVLKDLMSDEITRTGSMMLTLKKNWDKIKYALPEYADEKPAEPTPEEKRKIEYDSKLEKINTDQSLRARQRVKQIAKLNEEYQDLFLTPQNSIVIPDDNGVTDVSSIFN